DYSGPDDGALHNRAMAHRGTRNDARVDRRPKHPQRVATRPAAPPVPAAPAARPRVEVVDAARGLAVAAMIVYHVCFDLTYYGWAEWPMLADPRWIAFRSAIVAGFVFVVG